MNNNFNLVKKPKKDDDEFIEEDEVEEEENNDEEDTTKNNNDNSALRKRLFITMGIIVGGMVLLLLILYIISLARGNTYSYSEIEGIMSNAAKKYFSDNSSYLPKDDGSVVEVDVSNLVSGGYMKDLSEYTKKGVTCSGSVQVESSSGDYLYTPYLNCGEAYSTIELYRKILDKESVVESGYGLYSRGGSYVFRGEDVNNYVKLDKSLWRIVKITSNNNIVLINNDGLSLSQPWDDRYNSDVKYNAGINNYSSSRIREFLQKVYDNKDEDDDAEPGENKKNDILSNKDKARLVSYNICTGKKASTSGNFDNADECSDHLNNQKIGLLTVSDYAYASIDPNCKSITSKSCQNYNYLDIEDEWWLTTPSSSDSTSVYQVKRSGAVEPTNASSYCVIRPVVYLNGKTLYRSGNGTKEKPYKVR